MHLNLRGICAQNGEAPANDLVEKARGSMCLSVANSRSACTEYLQKECALDFSRMNTAYQDYSRQDATPPLAQVAARIDDYSLVKR
jgi:hypothetical protein